MPEPVASTRDEWIGEAACKGMDPNLFFPEYISVRVRVKVDEAARKACADCPVLEQCADWAVKHEPHGFQGGLTEQQRAQLRRKLNLYLWEPQRNITTGKQTKRLLPTEISHGTARGYKQEAKRGIGHCQPCTTAHTQASKEAKARMRERQQNA